MYHAKDFQFDQEQNGRSWKGLVLQCMYSKNHCGDSVSFHGNQGRKKSREDVWETGDGVWLRQWPWRMTGSKLCSWLAGWLCQLNEVLWERVKDQKHMLLTVGILAHDRVTIGETSKSISLWLTPPIDLHLHCPPSHTLPLLPPPSPTPLLHLSVMVATDSLWEGLCFLHIISFLSVTNLTHGLHSK